MPTPGTSEFISSVQLKQSAGPATPDAGFAQLYYDTNRALGLVHADGSTTFLSQPVFNVKDYGAVGNGTYNDTSAIQAALDAVPATGGTVYFPAGTYNVSSVDVTGHPVTLDGPGAVLDCQGDTDGAIAKTDHGNLLTVRNLTFTGVSPAIRLAITPSSVTSHDYAFEDLTFNLDDTHPYAVSLVGAREGTLTRCTFIGGSDASGLYFQSTVAPTVADCLFIGSDGSGTALCYDGIADGYSCGLVVRACEVMGWDYGVDVRYTDWLSITDSTLDLNTTRSLRLTSQNGGLITGNYLGLSGAGAAVGLVQGVLVGKVPGYCTGLHIEGNTFAGAAVANYDCVAITDPAADQIWIRGNQLTFYTRYGVAFDGPTSGGQIQIMDNTFVARAGYGVSPIRNTGTGNDSAVYICRNRFEPGWSTSTMNLSFAWLADNMPVATQTTVGAAGGASALPATPSGYLVVQMAGTKYAIPYYPQA